MGSIDWEDPVRSDRREIVKRIVTPYLTAKKDRSVRGTYERLQPSSESRIHTSLNNVGTETGRLSSSEVFHMEASTNLQNIEKAVAYEDDLYRVRDIFVPDDGMVFLAADYEKAEAICAAAYMKDWKLYDWLHKGRDIHTWHAANYFNKPEEEVTKPERHIGKILSYASNYKASIYRLQQAINAESDKTGVKLTQKEVEKIHDEHLDLHPLEDWWDRVERKLSRQGYLVNALGQKRVFYNPNEHKRLKEALAFLPQSTVAAAINRALIRCYDELDRDGEVELLLQIHDELLFQVREDMLEETAAKVKEIMEEPFELHDRELFIPVEPEYGYRWESHRGSDPEDDGRLRSL